MHNPRLSAKHKRELAEEARRQTLRRQKRARSQAAKRGWQTRQLKASLPGAPIGLTQTKGRINERLQWQFLYWFNPEIYRTAAEREEAIALLQEVWWRTSGRVNRIEGAKMEVQWRNPDNRNPLHADWKTSADPGQSSADAFATLRKAMESTL